ncbi:MAG: SDR family NAD(P)-dependent oxidoreductase [Saprospiraceae bacterium]
MKNFASKIVLITGGGSGIGKIMSRLFLEREARVVIWDISQVNIDATLADLGSKGDITGYQVDVSSPAQISASAKTLKQAVGGIDVLINNAGIVVGNKLFSEHTAGDIIKTMEVNSTAPMLVAHEFLAGMLAKNVGHICNIASSGGLLGNPKMSVYAASKWSLVGWSDSLRIELQQSGKNVNVTTIMPYYINTGMFDGVKSLIPILDAEAACLTIVKAIEKNKVMVTLPGYVYRVTRFAQAILPIRVFDWFTGSVLGIYKTMDGFTGRVK